MLSEDDAYRFEAFLAKNVLFDTFSRINLELINVKFEGIDATPEWRDRLFYLRTGVSAAEVLRMETVQKSTESLSKSPGAAVGAGVAIVPPLFQPPAAPAQPMIICPGCGFQNPRQRNSATTAVHR